MAARVRARLARALSGVLGAEIPGPRRPLVAAVLLTGVASAVALAFGAIWAVSVVGLGASAVGTLLLGAGIAGGALGLLVGGLCDRLGATSVWRGLLLIEVVGLGGMVVSSGSRAFGGAALGVVLVAAAGIWTAAQAAAADAASASGTPLDVVFAELRVGQNVGFAVGPVLGAMLIRVGWSTCFSVVGCMVLGAYGLSLGTASRGEGRGAPAASGQETGHLRPSLALSLLLLGCVMAMTVYAAEGILVPFSVTTTHNLSLLEYSIVALLNPVLMVVLQLRVVQWCARARLTPRLVGALALMAFPFLILDLWATTLSVAICIALFTIGEIGFVPAAQDAVVGLAPSGRAGAAIGLFSATVPTGAAIGPFVGFAVFDWRGDAAMWWAFAGIGIGAAVVLAMALSLREGQRFQGRRSLGRDARFQ